jgi:bifunctional ADP-heptose synthase (sugar kinase/adenylyltransferase)
MLSRKKIFVIGDLIIDEYITGEAVGLSLESPTIKCEQTCTKKSPGGSGNVVMNLVALECDVGYMTVCSDISVYNALSEKAKVHSILSKKRTSSKQRYYVERNHIQHKHLQMNYTDDVELSGDAEKNVIRGLTNILPQYECVILSDYRCGVLSKKITAHIINVCKKLSIPCIANTQLSDWGNKTTLQISKFGSCDLIVLNEEEAKAWSSTFLWSKCQVVETMGKGGSKFNDIHVPSIDTTVVDTCGAGDSFTAMLATQDWSHDVGEVLYKCNLWAGLSTETKGATPPSFDLFKERYEER